MGCVEVSNVLLGVCAFFFLGGGQAESRRMLKRNVEPAGVSIALGSLEITSTAVELRCEIRNECGQDIWIYNESPARRPPEQVMGGLHGMNKTSAKTQGNAEVLVDTDGKTLLVFRRMNPPSYEIVHTVVPWAATYDRLRSGQSRAHVLSVSLPVRDYPISLRRGFIEATDRGIVEATKLAFEIGYYTTSCLNSPKGGFSGHRQIRFSSAGDQVTIVELSHGPFWEHERAARITVDGLRIPFKQWHVAYRACEPERTASQMLADLFYDSSMSLTEYRYAQRLFSVDACLFDDVGRRIADVYVQVTESRLQPAELTKALGAILPEAEREKMLHALEKKQAKQEKK